MKKIKMNKKNYYLEAFKEKPNIFFLLLISLLFVFSSFNWLIVSGLILETLYLLIIPSTVYYRKYLDFKKNNFEQIEGASGKTKNEIIGTLPQNIRGKYEALERKNKEINGHISRNNQLKELISEDLQKINHLLANYLEFSVRLADYRNYLMNNNEKLLQEEIKSLKSRIERVYDSLGGNNNLELFHKMLQKKELLQNNLSIVQKRLIKINQMKGATETLQAQLDVMEDTFYLISDHIITFNPSENINNINVNGMIHNIENTEKILKDTFEEINKIKNLQINKIIE